MIVPFVAAGAGLLLAAGAVASGGTVAAGGTDLRGSRDTLPQLAAAREEAVAGLRDDVAALRREVGGDRDRGDERDRGERDRGDRGRGGARDDPTDADVRQIEARSRPLLAPVGLSPVRGPAVAVVLSDAPRETRGLPLAPGVPEPEPDDLVVHQQDVQAVVNALWSGGAEAMTIMGRRVTSLTAVRCVGNTLLLQGDVYSPPFEIVAIGDTGGLVAALEADPGVDLFRQYARAYRLGYRVDVADDVTLPGYDGPIELRHAQPG
jgi:uncharacterized protein YlxW (UPF0749 family)